jgi:hypothetical protein
LLYVDGELEGAEIIIFSKELVFHILREVLGG